MKKIIWITGAGSGIGKALAIAYGKQGNTIILSGRKKEQLEEISTYIDHSFVLPLDVSQEDQITKATQTVEKKYNHIDVLINNAGISQRSLTHEITNDVGRTLMEVNFFGSIHLTKAVLPIMMKVNRGTIVAMSSAAGKFGFPLRSYYSASKHAIHGFYESLSLELKDTNIKVTVVCPGRIKTDISKNALNGEGQTHDKMDQGQLNGIPVDQCANQIIRGIAKSKSEIYIGGKEIILIYIKRFFPALFRFIAQRVDPE
ncbi:SDR family oxidoreductase [Bacteroidia bacterium]|nr:SDR family oxidoreductase [Bacteroidia bacterium]